MIYACSENDVEPLISLDAVRWASEFALHQNRRQLYLASVHVAENPFHKECLKFVKKLKEHPEKQMQRLHLLKYMKCKAAEFDQIVLTLVQQGEIDPTLNRFAAFR